MFQNQISAVLWKYCYCSRVPFSTWCTGQAIFFHSSVLYFCTSTILHAFYVGLLTFFHTCVLIAASRARSSFVQGSRHTHFFSFHYSSPPLLPATSVSSLEQHNNNQINNLLFLALENLSISLLAILLTIRIVLFRDSDLCGRPWTREAVCQSTLPFPVASHSSRLIVRFF